MLLRSPPNTPRPTNPSPCRPGPKPTHQKGNTPPRTQTNTQHSRTTHNTTHNTHTTHTRTPTQHLLHYSLSTAIVLGGKCTTTRLCRPVHYRSPLFKCVETGTLPMLSQTSISMKTSIAFPGHRQLFVGHR